MALVVKNPPPNAGDIRDSGSIPRPGRSPGGGHGNSIKHSCLENPMDRGDLQIIVHRVIKIQTWLKKQHCCIYLFLFIFGCAGSSLLHTGFLQLQRVGGTL